MAEDQRPSGPEEEHRRALELIYTDKLRKVGDYVEVPTALFIQKIDIKMPPLPPVAFYEKTDTGMELLRSADEDYSRLALSSRESVYVKVTESPHIKRYAESQILRSSSPGSLPSKERMEVLRRAAITVVDDLFTEPTQENIRKSTKIVSSFVYVLMKEPKAYMLLAKLSSHDPYTLQHSVGTAVNSIILARKIGITDEHELNAVGLAGLLHDIGKVQVKREIINKPGPLDETEWEEMRQHPELGHRIVENNPDVPEETKRAILEHHEEPDGTGYPKGLKGDEISVFARIVCLCDVFNALTTDRTYSKARTPYDAFNFIRDNLSHKVDPDLFKSLVLVYGGKTEQGEE